MEGGVMQPLLLAPSGSSKPRKNVSAETESITWDPPTDRPRLRQHNAGKERRRYFGFTGRTATGRVATICSGILIGIMAMAVQGSIEYLVQLRNELLERLFSINPGRALGIWAGGSVAVVVVSGVAVQLFAPKAAGAGVTLVMAYLNGVDVRGLLSIPVFVIKFLGLVGSKVAGLAVGPEGPMVHLGACVASIVCTCEPWFLRRLHRPASPGSEGKRGTPGSWGKAGAAGHVGEAQEVPPPAAFFRNSEHREMVSAGAAAGMAAAFGAPIGGVLFAMEEAATSWSRSLGWRCFLCTTCSAFTLAQLHPRSQMGMVSFKADTPMTNQQWLLQSPFVILVSVCGGLLGAAFNWLRKRLWPLRASRKRTLLRLAEAAGVTLATLGIMGGLSLTVGRCMALPEAWAPEQGIRLACGEGEYNDLATALLGSEDWFIRTLLNLGSQSLPTTQACGLWTPCYFSWPSLAALSASYLFLMALASSLCVPGGLFMPSLMVGGSFGALFGFVLLRLLPAWWQIQPGTYALLCATAVLGGVFRSSFSLVVIVVEGTGGISYLLGIIMAVLVSNLVASRLQPHGVYESELERDGNVYYLAPEAPRALKSRTAKDIMATPVVGVESIVSVSGIWQLLQRTRHNGFPVYSPGKPRDPATGMGRLDGFILRSQLEVLLQRRAYCDAAGAYMSKPADVAAYEEHLHQEMRAAQTTSVTLFHPRPPGAGGPLPSHYSPPRSLHDAFGSGHEGADSKGSAAQPTADRRLEEGLPPGIPSPTGAGQRSPRGLTLDAAAAAAGLLPPPHSLQQLEPQGGVFLNLAAFMDRAPLVVRPNTLGRAVHHLFLSMSLRHLCVVDTRNYVLGIITRKDLDHAAGDGWWRMNQIAPRPNHSRGLRPTASWLDLVSLAGPRRLLSSIQAAFSPLASPLSSRRGTPLPSTANSPWGTPVGTPRASAMEAGEGGHPFWQSPAEWVEQAAATNSGRGGAAWPGAASTAAGAEALSGAGMQERDQTGTLPAAGLRPASAALLGPDQEGLAQPLRLARISPGRRRPPSFTFPGGIMRAASPPEGAAVATQAPSPFLSSIPNTLPLGGMVSILEEEVWGEQGLGGAPTPAGLVGAQRQGLQQAVPPAPPRWARAISKKSSKMLAFGSVAFQEEGEGTGASDAGVANAGVADAGVDGPY